MEGERVVVDDAEVAVASVAAPMVVAGGFLDPEIWD